MTAHSPSSEPKSKVRRKKILHNPDDLKSTIDQAIEKKEKLDARRAKLEDAKKVLTEEGVALPSGLDEKIKELEETESPMDSIPEWTKNTDWIEHNQKAKVALEKALIAMKDVPGAEDQVKALQRRLDKINKLFETPKQNLHGLTHVDYAKKVKKVLDTMELEGEGSEAKIDAQRQDLIADLTTYEDTYQKIFKAKGSNWEYLEYFHKQERELSERLKYTKKIVEKHEKSDKGDKHLDNLKKLIKQIELNINDIYNKRLVFGDVNTKFSNLVPSEIKDEYSAFLVLDEKFKHFEILRESGVPLTLSKSEKEKVQKEKFETTETLRDKLRNLIEKTNDTDLYKNKLKWLPSLKEMATGIIDELEKKLNKEKQKETDDGKTPELNNDDENILYMRVRGANNDLPWISDLQRISADEIMQAIPSVEVKLKDIEQWQKELETDLKEILGKHEKSKEYFGQTKKMADYRATANTLLMKYRSSPLRQFFPSALSYRGEFIESLQEAIKGANKMIEDQKSWLEAAKKLLKIRKISELEQRLKVLKTMKAPEK